MAIYVATLDARHFSFMAAGETAPAARAALRAGFMRHAAQVNGRGDSMERWSYFSDGVRVDRLEPGECLRDGAVI